MASQVQFLHSLYYSDEDMVELVAQIIVDGHAAAGLAPDSDSPQTVGIFENLQDGSETSGRDGAAN
jgi:hypothetical protein